MLMVSGVVGGVDTHADVHVAAAIDSNGGVLGIESFPTDEVGYRSLTDWLVGFGPVVKVGVEGTGSYGVGLARYLYNEGIVVVEVDRPDRQKRRKLGKSDPIDAEAAARAALSGSAKTTPKRRDGTVEQMRVLMIALREAVAVQAALTLPDAVSEHVKGMSGKCGDRLAMLLAVTGLNGLDPISDSEGSRRIGRSRVRVGQLRRRLFVLRDQARPPAGAWMPQVGVAGRDGWPDEYTEAGIEATRVFFGVEQRGAS